MDFYKACKSDTRQRQALKVDLLLESMHKKDAESLRKAMLDQNISTRSIKRVLGENKIICGCYAINAWRQANKIKLTSSRETKRES